MEKMEQDKRAIPIQRNLDGIYFRVVRNGISCNCCFTDLSLAEREKVLNIYSRDSLYQLVNLLADTIRKIGEEANIRGVRDKT